MNQEKQVALNKATKRVLDLWGSTGMAAAPFEKTLGLAEGTIKNLKNGRNNASADTICRVAEYFEVTTDYVMGYTDFPKSPTSWYVFRRMVAQLNKSWNTVSEELNKPLSFFVDWEHGQEPSQIELWSICNAWHLKVNPFEKLKKSNPSESSSFEISNISDIGSILANGEGIDYIEKIYKQFEWRQKVYVLTWLIGYAQSQGIQIKL